MKIEFKKYTKKKFDDWCEAKNVDEHYAKAMWNFIKNSNVNLKMKDIDYGILTIKVALEEVS